MSKAYFTTGASSLFEMSTADARRILPAHLEPVEVRPQRAVLNISAFHFRDSVVGPYAELVLSVLVPPLVGGFLRHPKAGFFPFMAATSSQASRDLLRTELRMPTHPESIDLRFVERTDGLRVQVWCEDDPVVDMAVTVHKWKKTTHLLQSYMMHGDERLKADVQISGTYSMHEHESGHLQLFPHAITSALSLDEVSPSPFREHWLKEGYEQFSQLESL